MARSVEHIVAMHQLAEERRKAGKPVWAYKVDLSEVFHNDDIPFEDKRGRIATTIKASNWYRDRADFSNLDEIADGLAFADDTEEFDGWFDELYDRADYDRAWIKTV